MVGGAIRVECLDREGKVLGVLTESVRDLAAHETVRLEVPVRTFPGTVRLRLTD